MTHELLKKKVIAEIEVSPNGLTPYGVFTFIADEISSSKEATRFMIDEGYRKSEVSKARASYNHNQNRKALTRTQAF